MKLFLRLASLSLLSLATAAGCGSRARAPQTPLPSPSPGAASGPDVLATNTERDRRADAGVRGPAKPLVREAKKTPKCGKLAAAALWELKSAKARRAEHEPPPPIDMLAGRLRVGPLGSGRVLPAPKDGPSLEEESRIVVDADHEGLAIVAKEIFQLDPDRWAAEADAKPQPGTLDEEAPKFLKAAAPNEEGLEITPVTIGDGPSQLRAYAARPKEPNAPPGQDVALVLALLVAHLDGTLQSVTFHVRGEMVRSATGSALVGCTRLAERVAETITVGPRALERAAGPRLLPSGGGTLQLQVPADYVAVKGEDQLRLYKLRPISLFAGSMTIVVGAKREGDAIEPGAEVVPGKLLGRETRWQKKTRPLGGGFLHASEALEPGGARFVDVLLKTRTTRMLDEMQKVAETLRAKP